MLADEPDIFAAVAPLDVGEDSEDGKLVLPVPVPLLAPETAPESAAEPVPDNGCADDGRVDETPVPPVADGLFPMNPSEGVSVGVTCDESVDSVGVASVLDGADVCDGTGLEASVNVCVVPYVPPRSSLMVLKAIPPVGSGHSSTVTVWVESSADEMAVPTCRLCNS